MTHSLLCPSMLCVVALVALLLCCYAVPTMYTSNELTAAAGSYAAAQASLLGTLRDVHTMLGAHACTSAASACSRVDAPPQQTSGKCRLVHGTGSAHEAALRACVSTKDRLHGAGASQLVSAKFGPMVPPDVFGVPCFVWTVIPKVASVVARMLCACALLA